MSTIKIAKIYCLSNFDYYLKYGVIYWGNFADILRAFKLQKRAIRSIFRILAPRKSCKEVFNSQNNFTLLFLFIYEILKCVKDNCSQFPK